MIDPEGNPHVGSGKFTQVIENQKISYTWSWQDMPDFGANSLVTFELFDAENPYDKDQPATEIVLTHEKLNTAAERSEHTGGWWNCLRPGLPRPRPRPPSGNVWVLNVPQTMIRI